MTMTADQYIDRVLHHLPHSTPLRTQIAAELRGSIAERTAGGAPMDAVLLQLGDPETLAESYLSAIPLVAAPFMHRVAAKFIDFFLMFFAVAPIMYVIGRVVMARFRAADASDVPELMFFIPVLALLVTSILFSFYTAIAKYAVGTTVGKHLLGLRVVRESGARISIGQSIVRQLAGVFQVTLLDALFALFTEKHQRAFELLSKTRVVIASR